MKGLLYFLIVTPMLALSCARIPTCDSTRFRNLRMIGDGGQANLYLVLYNRSIYVEKKFHNDRAFNVELEAISCIPKHPSIVRVVCQDRSRRVMMLERIVGHQPESFSIHQLRDLIKVIQGIHRSGFIHGDIKPSNIFVRPNGSMVLIDFGLARRKSNLNGRFGTAGYMAPEVNQGRPNHNESLDWWSLGITAQKLLRVKNKLSNDLIGRMLERNPARRLARCTNLANHPLFQ